PNEKFVIRYRSGVKFDYLYLQCLSSHSLNASSIMLFTDLLFSHAMFSILFAITMSRYNDLNFLFDGLVYVLCIMKLLFRDELCVLTQFVSTTNKKFMFLKIPCLCNLFFSLQWHKVTCEYV